MAKDVSVDDLSVQLALAFSADAPIPVKEEPKEPEETPKKNDDTEQPSIPKEGHDKKPKRVLTRRESLQYKKFCFAWVSLVDVWFPYSIRSWI